MKITATKRDDILKRKAEYEADFEARRQRHDDQYSRWGSAQRDVFQSVENAVRDALGKRAEGLDIRANTRWSQHITVDINNEIVARHNDLPLSWRWEVSIDREGNILKESSSWSGLKATTIEHVEQLRDIVSILEVLNTMDWATILNRELPKYDEYVTESDPRYDRNKPDFNKELFEAELEEYIGQDVLIKGVAGDSSYFRAGVPVYYMILSESPSQYTVLEAWADGVAEAFKHGGGAEAAIAKVKDLERRRRIRKDKLQSLLNKPLIKIMK